MYIKTLVTFLIGSAIVVGGCLLFHAPQVAQKVGALAGPDIASPYLTWGGVAHWAAHTENLTQATTTVCALQSPAATSTLRFGQIRFTVSSTSASTVYLAKAATPYATTTNLGSVALTAGAQGTVLASSSPSTPLDPSQVFGPNTYFVVGMAGGNAGNFSPTGVCQAEWVTI